MTRLWCERLGTLLVTCFLSTSAFACPLCNTGTGQQVRAGLFDGHFGSNLLLVLLPFPIFIGIALLLYFGPPTRPSVAAKQRVETPHLPEPNPVGDPQ